MKGGTPYLRSLRAGGAAGALAVLAAGDAPAVRAQSLTCSTDTDSDKGLFLKAAMAFSSCWKRRRSRRRVLWALAVAARVDKYRRSLRVGWLPHGWER